MFLLSLLLGADVNSICVSVGARGQKGQFAIVEMCSAHNTAEAKSSIAKSFHNLAHLVCCISVTCGPNLFGQYSGTLQVNKLYGQPQCSEERGIFMDHFSESASGEREETGTKN